MRKKQLLLAYLTVLGLSINLEPMAKYSLWLYEEPVKQLPLMFCISPVAQLLLLILLYVFYGKASELMHGGIGKRERLLCLVPAIMFAVFMLIGRSFYERGNFALISYDRLQIAKATIYAVGYSIIFYFFVASTYCAVLKHSPFIADSSSNSSRGVLSRYLNLLRARPFAVSFVTLLIVYLPIIILSYPSIIYGDTYDIVGQGYNLHERTSAYLNLIDDNIRLNNHHPIAFTLFVRLCMFIGLDLIGSCNLGIFIASFIQALASIAVFSLCIRLLVLIKARTAVVLSLMAFFAFSPLIQNYIMVNTKDVLYMCAFVLFYCVLYAVLNDIKAFRRNGLMLVLSALSVCLLRNDGKYLVVICCLLAMLIKGATRKKAFATMIISIAVMILYSSILLPAFSITPGSRREILSVPFQQTARYVRDCEDEVTEYERETISKVLDYDSLAERYYPQKADPVKASYNEDASNEELIEYFKVWFEMLKKHPRIYLEATLSNYYNYLYPGARLTETVTYDVSAKDMENFTKYTELPSVGIEFSHPEALGTARELYETVRESLFTAPIFTLFKSSAVIVWGIILLFFILLIRREYALLIASSPLYIAMLTWFLGPCNGDYFRYQYSAAVCLPVAIAFSLCTININNSSLD